MPNSEGKGEKDSANVAVDKSPAAPLLPVKPEPSGKSPGLVSKLFGFFCRSSHRVNEGAAHPCFLQLM